MRTTTIRIEDATAEKLESYAREDEVRVSDIIRSSIKYLIRARENDPDYLAHGHGQESSPISNSDSAPSIERRLSPEISIIHQISRLEDQIYPVRKEQEKSSKEREIYSKALSTIEVAESGRKLTAQQPLITPGEDNTFEVERKSLWDLHETVTCNDENYIFSYRFIQQERCLLGDPLLPNRESIDQEEWREQPLVLERLIRHDESGLEQIYPVARFTPHGASYQRCSIEWADTDPNGETFWRDLDVMSDTDYAELAVIQEKLAY